MTKISITKYCITIEGHANFDTIGKDIVCATISGILIYMIREHNLDHDIQGGMVTKVYYETKHKKAINTFRELMQELSSQYPKNVKIEG